MKINVTSFADAGNFQKERVVMKVSADIELGEYAIFFTALSKDGGATSGKKMAYWFPDGGVKKDDLVVLYTKHGSSSKKELSGGRTAHFFYWGDDRALWDGGGNGAVIVHVAGWSTKSPAPDGG